MFESKNTYEMDVNVANAALQNIFAECDVAPNTTPFDKLLLRQKPNVRIYNIFLLITAIVLFLTALLPLVIVLSPDPAIASHRSENLSSYHINMIQKGARDNTPVVLKPNADGSAEIHNDVASIDYSHIADGYVCASYSGKNSRAKLRITGPDSLTYTYDLHGSDYNVFPLSCGNGIYDITVYENIAGTSYSTCLYEQIDVAITNEFSPYLYPNQYVNFNRKSKVVDLASKLTYGADTDLDAVTAIYNYITTNITYDYEKASAPPTGYVSDVDAILESGCGICLDYAAVMASMLRSQLIPTRLEVGYASDAYHAWLSIYTVDTGWLNGILEFDGNDWNLADPTFGANASEENLRKFIGSGDNYTLQKIY